MSESNVMTSPSEQRERHERLVMCICNDCKKGCDVGLVRGVSDLAGGEYYSGPEICEHCMIIRRENAIILHETANWDSKKHGTGPLLGDY